MVAHQVGIGVREEGRSIDFPKVALTFEKPVFSQEFHSRGQVAQTFCREKKFFFLTRALILAEATFKLTLESLKNF